MGYIKVAQASLLAALIHNRGVAADSAVCNSGVYAALAPYSNLPAVKSYCASKYPVAAAMLSKTVTVGITKGVVASRTVPGSAVTVTQTNTYTTIETGSTVVTSIVPATPASTCVSAGAQKIKRASSALPSSSSSTTLATSASTSSKPTSTSTKSNPISTSAVKSTAGNVSGTSTATTSKPTSLTRSDAASTVTTSKSTTTGTPLLTVKVGGTVVTIDGSIASAYCSCVQAPKTVTTTATTTSTQTVTSMNTGTVTSFASTTVTETQTNTIVSTSSVAAALRTYSDALTQCSLTIACTNGCACYTLFSVGSRGGNEAVCVSSQGTKAGTCKDSCDCPTGQVCIVDTSTYDAASYSFLGGLCAGQDNAGLCGNTPVQRSIFERGSAFDT